MPGCVEHVSKLCRENPERVRCLRGNHEQMLLDFIDRKHTIWVEASTGEIKLSRSTPGSPGVCARRRIFGPPVTRSQKRFRQSSSNSSVSYRFITKTNSRFTFTPARRTASTRARVRLTLCCGRATRTSTRAIAASRACSATRRRLSCRCADGSAATASIVHNSAIGIDTGYNLQSPLSCLSLPDFTLYQTFADGRTATHHITTMIPESLKEMQRKAARSIRRSGKVIFHFSFDIFHLSFENESIYALKPVFLPMENEK